MGEHAHTMHVWTPRLTLGLWPYTHTFVVSPWNKLPVHPDLISKQSESQHVEKKNSP